MGHKGFVFAHVAEWISPAGDLILLSDRRCEAPPLCRLFKSSGWRLLFGSAAPPVCTGFILKVFNSHVNSNSGRVCRTCEVQRNLLVPVMNWWRPEGSRLVLQLVYKIPEV